MGLDNILQLRPAAAAAAAAATAAMYEPVQKQSHTRYTGVTYW